MKTKNVIMTNGQIYQIALELLDNFTDNNFYLPAAIAFSIEKNKQNLIELATDIEQSRISILNHYRSNNIDDENIEIPNHLIEQANNELKNLLDIQSEIKIYTFKIEELEEVKFTSNQIKTILFMIDEE